jgi:tetratricopeptide (TPR) repeat protein
MAGAAAAERSGDLRKALAGYTSAAALNQAGASAKVESVRKDLIKRHTQLARNAFTKQDLDGAIQNWDKVLELDPINETAKFERKKAIDLKEKLKAIK